MSKCVCVCVFVCECIATTVKCRRIGRLGLEDGPELGYQKHALWLAEVGAGSPATVVGGV